MKSLEHVIRDIREGKCECEKKKESLEHTIRKVRRKEYESSYAAKDSKPVDEDVAGMCGSTDGKSYGESGKKKVRKEDGGDKLPGNEDKMDESISVVPANYQGNQFKSVRTAMPRIEPPKGADDHPQSPKNVARQRTLAKERVSQTVKQHMHAEAVELLAPVGAGLAAGVAGAAAAYKAGKPFADVVKAGKKGVESFSSKIDSIINPDPEKLKAAQEKLKAADAAKAKMDIAPKVDEKPKAAPPVELPTTTGAPAAAPVGKTTTAAPPATNVGAQAKPVSEPVAKPATDAAPTTKPAEVSVPKTNIGTAAKAATAVAAATAAAPKGRGNYPSISGGAPSLDPTSHGAKAITHKAGTRLHTAKKLGEDTKSREEIENMPRKGDRKSIEYVGRKDADPKSTKEKTSRLATIKNVIDEAKKLKTAAELDKPTKVYDYNKGDYIIINPDAKKNTLDVKEP